MAPKKGKKGGKGKKGKKSGKKGKKVESADKQAIANEKIWQARLRTTEKTKDNFKDNCQQLSSHNEMLQSQMKQVELDTIDVITFLKAQDQKKDTIVSKLEDELKKCLEQNEQEKKTLIKDYTEQIETLQSDISKKQDDLVLMQNELKHVKEFRKKRVAMQRELDEIKDAMFLANREHKEDTSRMIEKFEAEKVSMQQDTNQKISELADRAHQQAITNLDETARSIYKENVRLTEALRFHTKEAENLRKQNFDLEKGIDELKLQQTDTESVVQQKVSETQTQKRQITETEERIEALEKVINDLVNRFDKQQRHIHEMSDIEAESSGVEISKLGRLCELKAIECSKVRKLSRHLLSQRTDVEQHFLNSLNQAKEDIAFHLDKPKKHVSVSDLPWESRESILRSLFVKMNSNKPVASNLPLQNNYHESTFLPMSQEQTDNIRAEIFADGLDEADMTFLTQGDFTDPTFA
ncbi:CCDC176 [Bugula neritina]|uniref:Basal body-orientation factor 1 n=1 Tax=Bugula neritina TaxID=10212 RepID=A0A7J7J8L6_BUGNE|nr:CCDC176 [Bugula neritina]